MNLRNLLRRIVCVAARRSCRIFSQSPTSCSSVSLSLNIYLLQRPLNAPSFVFSSFGIIPTRRFGRAPPLEDSRAEGMCPNWYKPISMEIYQSITSSPTVSTVLVTPMTPSKPCILVVVSELSFDTDLHSYYKITQHHTVSSNGI